MMTLHTKRWFHFVVGGLLGLALLWFVFRDTDWPAVGRALAQAQTGWIALSVVFVAASFFTRVRRWSYIVRACGPASFRSLFSATQIGFMANFILPARIGEPIRALVLTRLTRIPFSKAFATVALDRSADLVALIAVMLVAVAAFRPEGAIHLPPSIYSDPIPGGIIRTVAASTGLLLVAVLACFALLYVRQAWFLRVSDAVLGVFSKRLAGFAHRVLEHFADGLHVFRSAKDLLKTVGWSLATWGCFILTYYALLRAFDTQWPWYTPFILVSLLSAAIAVPGAPGFVGQFHIAIVIAANICLPSLAVNEAKAIAIVAHLINLIPIVAVGVFCLMWEDLGLFELTRASSEAQERLEQKEDGATAPE